MTKTALITGAAGYLGARLSAALHGDDDWHVRALTHAPANFVQADEHVVADCLGPMGALVDAMSGVDAVVHLAGANEVETAEAPDRALADTVRAAWQVAMAADAAAVARVVYLSTVHVYGPPADGQVLSEDVVPTPRQAYAVARLASEHATATVARDVVVLRLTNAVGAPAHPAVRRWTLVANDLCRQAATTGRLQLRTHGMQWRDFVSMDDVCRSIAAAADPAVVPEGTYNLGSGIPTTVRQLAELVQDSFEARTGQRPPLDVPPPPDEPPKPYFVSVQRLAELGVRPGNHLRAAVDETAAFCVVHRKEIVT